MAMAAPELSGADTGVEFPLVGLVPLKDDDAWLGSWWFPEGLAINNSWILPKIQRTINKNSILTQTQFLDYWNSVVGSRQFRCPATKYPDPDRIRESKKQKDWISERQRDWESEGIYKN